MDGDILQVIAILQVLTQLSFTPIGKPFAHTR